MREAETSLRGSVKTDLLSVSRLQLWVGLDFFAVFFRGSHGLALYWEITGYTVGFCDTLEILQPNMWLILSVYAISLGRIELGLPKSAWDTWNISPKQSEDLISRALRRRRRQRYSLFRDEWFPMGRHYIKTRLFGWISSLFCWEREPHFFQGPQTAHCRSAMTKNIPFLFWSWNGLGCASNWESEHYKAVVVSCARLRSRQRVQSR